MSVQCKWCRHVHDAATVTVVQRFKDCSVWACPGCGVLIDDRPERWGGSAIPMSATPIRAVAMTASERAATRREIERSLTDEQRKQLAADEKRRRSLARMMSDTGHRR